MVKHCTQNIYFILAMNFEQSLNDFITHDSNLLIQTSKIHLAMPNKSGSCFWNMILESTINYLGISFPYQQKIQDMVDHHNKNLYRESQIILDSLFRASLIKTKRFNSQMQNEKKKIFLTKCIRARNSKHLCDLCFQFLLFELFSTIGYIQYPRVALHIFRLEMQLKWFGGLFAFH